MLILLMHYGTSPLQTIKTETVAGLGGGAGAAVAQQAAPESIPAEVTGQVVGSIITSPLYLSAR